ncbi:pyruvate dehydrogenase (acetyl-transferring) E1 component subunit alpha [Serinibacter salmoneus]|uniref:pyruvate dehydrogenase (acetyl-transferring) E1 component subunit alpha n=1 Tax=Serinibacter salmoneus TaxID=556530 RepID=UPI003CCB74BF
MPWSDPCDVPGTLRLLTPQGERVAPDPAVPNGEALASLAATLDAERLLAMYADMSLTRAFDREATSLQRQGELGLWPESRGQEAAQIGSAHALAPRDYVFPSYREHGVAHVRGLPVRELLHLFRGTQHGGWDPAPHNFHLYTLVIGSHTLHATGYAMGIQRDGDVGTGDPARDRAVITYFGDGATAQGDVNEALVFAATTNAPVVFFCQNNQWAISAPSTVQSAVPLVERGGGFGVPSIRVDGNDVLACYAATATALQRARRGEGPTFIEAVTYRMGAHTTSDDPTRYRMREEEEHWGQRDPIARLAALLRAEGVLDDEAQARIDAEAAELTAGVRTYCRSLTPPAPESMFDHVYAEPHQRLDAERSWFRDYQSSFLDATAGR